MPNFQLGMTRMKKRLELIFLPFLFVSLANSNELTGLCNKKIGNLEDLSLVTEDLKKQTKTIANESGRQYIYIFDGEINCGGYHVPFRSFGYDFKNECGLVNTVSNKFGWIRSRVLSEEENSREECKLICGWGKPEDCKAATPSFIEK